MSAVVPVVVVGRRTAERVSSGHPWVFSNELDGVASLPPGGTVDVRDGAGRFLGRGYANPRSLISVRLLARDAGDVDSAAFFATKLREALAYRAAACPGRVSMRLVHGEADGLPGLVIDRFGDVLSVQVSTLGIEVRKDALAAALREVLTPRGVVLRSDRRLREMEGLAPDTGPWFGDVPETVDIDEHGVRFRVSPGGGQKTGHFFDQADNRRAAAALCRGRHVLDVFSYTGGFALHALAGGAASATCVDSSDDALARARENASRNGCADRLEVSCGDAREVLAAMQRNGRRFDVVSVDPPAFAKSKKVAARALVGYRDLFAAAAALVVPAGLLFLSSCSYHVHEDRFADAVAEGLRKADRTFRVLRRGEQAPDHPTHPAIPESRYLKHLALWVCG
jgi:23S rRNA (cytosine1962-C5)-methyltransferase